MSERYTLHQGDNRDVLKMYDDNTFDSIVTDSPYGLKFMGKDWDRGVPGEAYWREMLRVAKPGAYLLAFGGTRTSHRLACAIEDAGWELRDTIMWVYGSGFPKSLDVSKAIDKAAGVEREVIGQKTYADGKTRSSGKNETLHQAWQRPWRIDDPQRVERRTAPATPDGEQWAGWGTALKPAWEPIIVARKPLEGAVAENVLKWGTGAINVDGCRVGTGESWSIGPRQFAGKRGGIMGEAVPRLPSESNPAGRFPANLVHDGSDEVMELFPLTMSGKMPAGQQRQASRNGGGYHGNFPDEATAHDTYGDTGSAARFFYCAKATKEDRDEGLPDGQHSGHPTVKPTALMRWLVRLVTPLGGVVLDPFMGSGSTGKAALLEGFRFAGIDSDAGYVQIAHHRIGAAEITARNAAGDITPTTRERASAQLSLFD